MGLSSASCSWAWMTEAQSDLFWVTGIVNRVMGCCVQYSAKLGDSVLDICCGSGDVAFLLAEKVGPQGKVCISLSLSPCAFPLSVSFSHQSPHMFPSLQHNYLFACSIVHIEFHGLVWSHAHSSYNNSSVSSASCMWFAWRIWSGCPNHYLLWTQTLPFTNVLQVTGLDFAREQLDIATQRQLESVTASSIDMQ